LQRPCSTGTNSRTSTCVVPRIWWRFLAVARRRCCRILCCHACRTGPPFAVRLLLGTCKGSLLDWGLAGLSAEWTA